jgi:hypothetical protein
MIDARVLTFAVMAAVLAVTRPMTRAPRHGLTLAAERRPIDRIEQPEENTRLIVDFLRRPARSA